MAVSVTEVVNSLKLGISKDPITDAVLLTFSSWSNLAVQAVRSEFISKSLSKAGTSAQTIHALPVSIKGNVYTVQVTADEAVAYADKGVDGTETSHGSPYKFNHPKPSASHVEAILKWIPNASLKPDNPQHPRAYKSMAYAIATNVKKHGIEPKNFMAAGFDDESAETLALALGKVIKKAIEVKFNHIAKTI